MPDDFACALNAAAPLVQNLFEIAFEWAHTRKGAPVSLAKARAWICDFEDSPCGLFRSATELRAALRAHSNSALAEFARPNSTAELDQLLASRPTVAVLRSPRALTAEEWGLQRLLPGEHMLIAPQEAGPTDGKKARPCKKCQYAKLVTVLPPPVATEAVVWRAAGCEPPLWSLERSVPTSSAWLPPAAAAALRAGTPFSEFFACGTLEPLRHLARQLLAGTRRRGRSVWQSCFRPNSPCLWFCGNHSDGEHFLHQVLSSPAVLLRRMSEFRRTLDGALPALPPLRLLDSAAGDGAYTQHQPDGMGALPALPLVRDLGWSALLLEPIRSTYAWLERNFDGLHHATLRNYGVTPNATREMATMYALHGSVPELTARWPLSSGLPPTTRQRLQYASSIEFGVPRRYTRDLWQMNHLAGGPVQEALEQAGHAERVREFKACRKASSTEIRRPCYNLTVTPHEVSLLPFSEVLREALPAGAHIDLLVIDVHGRHVGAMLRSFPLETIKPTLIYHRHASSRAESKLLSQFLKANGYHSSPHAEVSAWGELALAWRADRCQAPGMGGRPLWHTLAVKPHR